MWSKRNIPVSDGPSARETTYEGQLEVGAQTTLVPRGLGPSQVGELGVGGNTNDLGVDTGELLERGVEGEDLSGADD